MMTSSLPQMNFKQRFNWRVHTRNAISGGSIESHSELILTRVIYTTSLWGTWITALCHKVHVNVFSWSREGIYTFNRSRTVV